MVNRNLVLFLSIRKPDLFMHQSALKLSFHGLLTSVLQKDSPKSVTLRRLGTYSVGLDTNSHAPVHSVIRLFDCYESTLGKAIISDHFHVVPLSAACNQI